MMCDLQISGRLELKILGNDGTINPLVAHSITALNVASQKIHVLDTTSSAVFLSEASLAAPPDLTLGEIAVRATIDLEREYDFVTAQIDVYRGLMEDLGHRVTGASHIDLAIFEGMRTFLERAVSRKELGGFAHEYLIEAEARGWHAARSNAQVPPAMPPALPCQTFDTAQPR